MNEGRVIIIKRDIGDLVKGKYVPYAMETIVNRALPYIDGLKPVARKILWGMYESGVYDRNGKKVKRKCARVVGDIMGKYHPHGDKAIYDVICGLGDSSEGLNAPLVIAQGNFGKAWSSKLKAAAMRYTECKLSPLALEMLNGITENAVDFVPNFDETEKEPVLLPSRFPNILVNTFDGIAVAMGSSLPSYNLKEVCDAAIAILSGQAKEPEDLIDVLGAPDFSFGGWLHSSREQQRQLLEKGSATFEMTGTFHQEGNKLVIDDVPYNTTFEKVFEEIKNLIKDSKEPNLKDVSSRIGLNSKGIAVEVKKGANMREVAENLCRMTSLRKKISFKVRLIWKGKPIEPGVFQLLQYWIEFRTGCVRRVYKVKYDKQVVEKHKLATWNKIADKLDAVIETIRRNKRAKAMELLQTQFDLSDKQAEYLLGIKLSNICEDMVEKSLADYLECEAEIEKIMAVLKSEEAVNNVIIEELQGIIEKYGKERTLTVIGPVAADDRPRNAKPEIPDELVSVWVTKNGLIKAQKVNLSGTMPSSPTLPDKDEFIGEGIMCSTKDRVLVFTAQGYCYKVPVHLIEQSRGSLKMSMWDIVERKDTGRLLYAGSTNNANDAFTLVYNNGRGRVIKLSDFSGPSKFQKSCYDPAPDDAIFVTKAGKLFVVTNLRKAAYIDISYMFSMNVKASFKATRIVSGEVVVAVQPESKVPDIKAIALERYSKGYTVTIGEDKLWWTPEMLAEKNGNSSYEEYEDYEDGEEDSEEE